MMDAPPPTEVAYVERVVSRAVACGVSRANVAVAYVDDLQDYELTVRASGPTIGATAMRCLVEVVYDTGVVIAFDPPTLYAAYSEAYDSHPRTGALLEQVRSDARARLERRGLLDRLPTYARGDDLADFARRLEAFAGFNAREVLRVTGSTIQIAPSDPAHLNSEHFSLLGTAIAAQPAGGPTFLISVLGAAGSSEPSP